MSRRWKGVALVAAWLGLVSVAHAQYSVLPNPIGPARMMPEPLPEGKRPEPPENDNLVPGPITPQMAPPGPDSELDLPANHTSAFQCENFGPEQAFYASIGALGLEHQKLGAGGLAVFDPQGIDTGNSPPRHTPVMQSFSNLDQQMNPGIRATVGYLFTNEAIELTGFYVIQGDRTNAIQGLGTIDGFFFNPPKGFEGDNGLWLQADKQVVTHSVQVANLEVNYRLWNPAVHQVEMLVGVRYMHIRDALRIFTGDDDLTIQDVNGNPDPKRQATYTADCHNDIIAPQIGFEGEWPLPTQYLRRFWLGWNAKAAVGPNVTNTNLTLYRGDGFKGFDNNRTTVSIGQIYEIGAFAEIHLMDRLRLRAGYSAFWTLGVATSVDQIDFNLANRFGRDNTAGSIFFHGPTLELQFLF